MGAEGKPTNYICVTCGAQFDAYRHPPDRCPVCEDERQYAGLEGQRWTTLQDLLREHRSIFVEEEPGLLGIGMEPSFAIGQRALLVQTPAGNVLWDCIPLIDDDAVSRVGELGGIAAIAISHPHYYSGMVEWSRAFDAPVYLHAADQQWVMRKDPAIVYWSEEAREVLPGLSLLRCGGHFDGGTVLHWAGGAEGRGVILSGDIIQVIPDRRWVSFMYSYPNFIPLPAPKIRHIVETVRPYDFDRIHGAWFGRVVAADAKGIMERSAERYINAIEGA
jgi:Metallo-beta-lactamase superfamily.